MKRTLIAGHWIDIPEEEKEKETDPLCISTIDLLIIQELLQRFKKSEANESVGFEQTKNIIKIERLLSFLDERISNRSKKVK